MTSFKKFAAAIALIALGLLIAAGLMEAVLRIYNPFQFRVRAGKIQLLANIKFTTENNEIKKLDRVVIHSKNSLGFRGTPPPRDFARWLTIIAVGGSTTECFYLSDGQDWPAVLGRDLSRDFERVWVNNAGLDGQSTYGHLLLLRDYIIPRHPKCALFLVGANDMGRDDLSQYDRGEEGLDFIRPKEKLLYRLADKSEAATLVMNLWRYLKGYRRGLNHREIDPAAVPALPPADPEFAAEQRRLHQKRYLAPYGRRLTEIIRFCRQNGIEPVLITQPALFGPGIDPVTGVDLGALEVFPKISGSLEWQIQELYNDETRQVGREHQVPVIDLARELPKDSRYFYDYYHFTRAGARQVGDIIARNLTPWLAVHFGGYRLAPSREGR